MSEGLPRNFTAYNLTEDNKRISDSNCMKCMQLQRIINRMSQNQSKLVNENYQLRQTVEDFERQNLDMMGKCGKTYREYENFVEKLNEQLTIRDEVINQLHAQIDESDQEFQKLEIQMDEKETNYQRKIMELEDVILTLQGQVDEMEKQLKTEKEKQLKIFKVQKEELTKKFQQNRKKIEMEVKKLSAELQSKEQIIEEKEELIKRFSKNNDELRIELLDLKAKQDVNDVCQYKGRKRNSSIYSEQETNDKLKAKVNALENKVFELQMEKLNAVRRIKQFEEQSRNKMENNQIKSRTAGKLKRQSSVDQKIEENITKAAIECLVSIYQFCFKELKREGETLIKYWKRMLFENTNEKNLQELSCEIFEMISEIGNCGKKAREVLKMQQIIEKNRPSSLNAINSFKFDS